MIEAPPHHLRTLAWGAALAVAALVTSLVIRLPLSKLIPLWFWIHTDRPLPAAWLILPALLLVGACVALVTRINLHPAGKLALLVLAGCLLQHGYALMEARGADGLRDRFTKSGHSLFALEAIRQPSLWRVGSQFQGLLNSGELGVYPHATKPPGQLLYYMATERIVRHLPLPGATPMARMANFVLVLWPLMAYLTLVPLYLFARLYLEPKTEAFLPCLIYLVLPPVLLIPLHLDQCLYPLLFMTTLTLAAYGCRRDRPALLVAAGLVASAGLFISFSLLVLLPLAAALIVLHGWKTRDWRRGALHLTAYGVGLFIVQAGVRYGLDYHLLGNYRYAMAIHQMCKIQAWPPKLQLFFGVVNLFEYAVWTGGAVALLACIAPGPLAGDARELRALRWLACGVLLALAFLSKTATETPRLWLFLMPLIALFAAAGLKAIARDRLWPAACAVLSLQLLNALALKSWQDFF